MLEIVGAMLLAGVIVAFDPMRFQKQSDKSWLLGLPEDSVLRRHFLTRLKSVIEAALMLHPRDCTLRRRYNTLVAIEEGRCTK